MKYNSNDNYLVNLPSPPSRGAWIEIQFIVVIAPGGSVAPLAGGVD